MQLSRYFHSWVSKLTLVYAATLLVACSGGGGGGGGGNSTLSTDATLSALTLSTGTLSPTFAAGTLTYGATVSNATTLITVTPTSTHSGAVIRVQGNQVTSGNASGGVALTVGSNTITILVTAQDTTTTKTYTVDVTRSPAIDANLAALSLSDGSLTPAFASGTTAYTTSVGNLVTAMTVTPTLSDAAATMTVNGAAVTSGNPSGSIGLAVGSGNTITIVVTAQDTVTTKTYTITVTRAQSSNADLSALTLSSGALAPAFDAATTTYTATITSGTASITATPTASHGSATITVNTVAVASGAASGALAMAVGDNTVTIVVTAEDSVTTKTYTVTVRRVSTNADLSALAISSGALAPVFAAGTTNYTASVANAVSSITVTPTRAHGSASITVNGAAVASGFASSSISLNVGANNVDTVVTAEDGITTKTYRVVFTRAPSSDATLSALTLSVGSLSPAFASGTTSYTAAVANTDTSITATPTATNGASTITVNGGATASGAASAGLPMSLGPNTVTVHVTAEDGVTTIDYVVTVSRAYAAGATLSNLVPNGGWTLSPTFDANTLSYTMDVNAATFTLTPTLTVGTGSITVDGVANADGAASGAIAIAPTETKSIDVVVTSANAGDDPNTLTYNIQAYRPSNDANLAGLTASACALSPAFAAGTTAYSCSQGGTTTTTVTPTLSYAGATVRVNGVFVTSGSPSGSISLSVGVNNITVLIRAENVTTTKTYTIAITRTSRAPAIAFSKPVTTVAGTTLKPITPINTGGPIESCSIAPKLAPGTGYLFDEKTCAISGTPTLPLSAGEYSVTAKNADGVSTAKLSLGTNLPGLSVWLDERGLASDAKEIGEWLDQSGRGNHLEQKSDKRRPRLVAGPQGHSVARFDGAQSYLHKASFTDTDQSPSFSVFTVAQPSTQAKTAKGFVEGPLVSLGALHVPSSTEWNVYSLVSSASEAILRVGGQAVSRYWTGGTAASPYLAVGRGADAERLWDGDIAEVQVFRRPLSREERVAVEQYLARKYALAEAKEVSRN